MHLSTYNIGQHSFVEMPDADTCSGTVIWSESWHARGALYRERSIILTAAHCVEHTQITYVSWYGEDGMLSPPLTIEGRVIAREWIVPDPSDTAAYRSDLALVEVDRKLPTAAMLFEPPVAGESVWIIGHPLNEPASIVQQFVAGMNARGFFVHTTTALPGDSGGGSFVLRRSCFCYTLVGVVDAIPGVSLNEYVTIPASKLTYVIPMPVVALFLYKHGVLAYLPAGMSPKTNTEK